MRHGKLGLTGVVAVLALASTALANKKDIVQTAVDAGQFKTLASALKAVGLLEALKGDGPFTVLAPTDEAFAKLPEGTVEALLSDPPKLRSVLKYHVLAGAVKAERIAKLKDAKTLLGQTVRIDASSGVKINDARVVTTDIACTNGVIHVIDTVLLPEPDLIDVARGAGKFTTLLAAIDAAGLMDDLRGEGPLTVFVPTDEAFAKLPEGTIEALLNDTAQLKEILLYHVVSGSVTSEEVVKLTSAKTLQGGALMVDARDDVRINGARVVKADVKAANGVVHVIDTVLIPR